MIDALLREITLQESYHNHKEKMAWTASSLYFLFTAAFAAWLISQTTEIFCIQKIIIAIVLLLVLVCGIIFIAMQFKMRWYSTDISVVLHRVVYQLLSGKSVRDYINESEPLLKLDGKFNYPEVIEHAIQTLHDKRKHWCKERKDDRYRTEIPTYCLMIILFASQIIVLCIWG